MAMSELLKKTVLVGIGVAAEVADRSKDLTDSLAKKVRIPSIKDVR